MKLTILLLVIVVTAVIIDVASATPGRGKGGNGNNGGNSNNGGNRGGNKKPKKDTERGNKGGNSNNGGNRGGNKKPKKDTELGLIKHITNLLNTYDMLNMCKEFLKMPTEAPATPGSPMPVPENVKPKQVLNFELKSLKKEVKALRCKKHMKKYLEDTWDGFVDTMNAP